MENFKRKASRPLFLADQQRTKITAKIRSIQPMQAQRYLFKLIEWMSRVLQRWRT